MSVASAKSAPADWPNGAGAVLEVMADDPAAPLDFDHFCVTGGHQLLKSTENNGVFTMRIVKSVE